MTEIECERLHELFLTQGMVTRCSHCHEIRHCVTYVVDSSTECFNCAVKRIAAKEEQENRLKRFNYEDFIRI